MSENFTKALALIKYFLIVSIVLVFNNKTQGQLKADFKIDNQTGCSPLTVAFTNASTGTSSATTYEWNFGNSGTSDEANPKAVYIAEKSYTVTLKVKDGAATDTKTATITVYKKPIVNFSASPASGCAPIEISFTSNSTPQDGTLSQYLWDFGDGTLSEGPDKDQPKHTYKFGNKPTVRLTVTNSFGCYQTETKGDILQIYSPVVPKFTADKTELCQLPSTVKFSNTSTGPGTLSYKWDFGNGQTSSEKDPAPQVYSTKGLYSVKLFVSSSQGCMDSLVKESFINAANFTTDFEMPSPVCAQNYQSFTEKSFPTPTSSQWLFSDNNYTQYGSTVSHYFNTPGSFNVKLTNQFGSCTETISKTVIVNESPKLGGFLNDKEGACLPPLEVNFKDTSSSSLQWHWNFGTGKAGDTSNIKAPAFSFTQGERNYSVALTVLNSNGCKSTVSKIISLSRPRVYINYKKTSSPHGLYGCPGLTLTFYAYPPEDIQEYKWDFGDGGTSTEKEPSYTFNKVGNFTVKLYFTTKSGCKDSVVNQQYVHTYQKPKADFKSESGSNICGNTPVVLVNTSDIGTSWSWQFGDGSSSSSENPNPSYDGPGEYDVTLIVANQYCSDTITKKAFIKGSGAYTNIVSATNTCNDGRGMVTFTQKSIGSKTWKWDFGDGESETFTSDRPTVTHSYKKNGHYKVFLSTSDDQCTTYDSISVDIFLKQHPELTSNKSGFCGSDTIALSISGIEPVKRNNYTYYYTWGEWQYGDGTEATTPINYFLPPLNAKVTKLRPGQDSIRLIMYNNTYGCYDTSNFVKITVSGPVAEFKVNTQSFCADVSAIFIDQSKGTANTAIKTWIWDYGDQEKDTFNIGGTVSHEYRTPNYYYPNLKVIDENGCSDYTKNTISYVSVNGPRADFYSGDTIISPGSSVQFINTTNSWPYSNYYVEFEWDFGDGSKSNLQSPVHTYSLSGRYTVKLIARNTITNCRDTIIKHEYIRSKTVFADFTLTTSYSSGKSCPPLVAIFVNTSTNAQRVLWDFGDNGGFSDRIDGASRTYYQPGIYRAVLYAYGDNGGEDSTVQFITVNGPYGTMHADVLTGCTPEQVSFKADVNNTEKFTWDFGDGNHDFKEDSALHKYVKPGIYFPKLILKDKAGCEATFEMKDSIIIDQLNASFTTGTHFICDSAIVPFKTTIQSLSQDSLNKELKFHWDFGTGNPKDTSNVPNTSFHYNARGKYPVSLEVNSEFGCTAILNDSILVAKLPQAFIAGPTEICEDLNVQFNGSSDDTDSLNWKWNFTNGNTSLAKDPPNQLYKDSGTYNITLTVNNIAGCADTTIKQLIVHGKPSIKITPQTPTVCLGDSIQLIATGGNRYNWIPSQGLNNATASNPIAFPANNIKYLLQVANIYGCENMDSVQLRVSMPFNITTSRDTEVCQGTSVPLQTTGAVSYEWLNSTGLNNPRISNPVATPDSTIEYRVVGYGSDQCFTDTTSIRITVFPVPTVDAGPDITALVGSVLPLKTAISNDATKIRWSPTTYLNCPSCPSPVSTPKSPINYNVTVSNRFGCTASDSVNIILQCAKSVVFIPNTFTPNNDGLNDVFYPRGRGIQVVKYFRIFNRWGELVFEKMNFNLDDRSAAWDGTYKGKRLTSDVFVYDTELICDNNESFRLNGNIMIIR